MSASEEFAALAQDSVREAVKNGLEVEVEEVEEEVEDLLEEVAVEEVEGPVEVEVEEKAEGSLEVVVEEEVEAEVEAEVETEVEDWLGEVIDAHIGEVVDAHIGEGVEEGVVEEVEAEVEAQVEAATEAWDLHLGNHLRWCFRENYCGCWLNLHLLCHLVRSSLFVSCPKPSQRPPPRPEVPPLPHRRLPQSSQTILEALGILPTKWLLLIVYTQPQLKNCFDAFAVKEGRENLSLRNEGV